MPGASIRRARAIPTRFTSLPICRRTARAIGAWRSSIGEICEPMMALLKNRLFLAALGLVLLALILWFAGPYFAFADYKPLESVVARLVAIIILIAVYALYVT